MFRPVVLFRCAALHLTLGSALALLPAASQRSPAITCSTPSKSPKAQPARLTGAAPALTSSSHSPLLSAAARGSIMISPIRMRAVAGVPTGVASGVVVGASAGVGVDGAPGVTGGAAGEAVGVGWIVAVGSGDGVAAGGGFAAPGLPLSPREPGHDSVAGSHIAGAIPMLRARLAPRGASVSLPHVTRSASVPSGRNRRSASGSLLLWLTLLYW